MIGVFVMLATVSVARLAPADCPALRGEARAEVLASVASACDAGGDFTCIEAELDRLWGDYAARCDDERRSLVYVTVLETAIDLGAGNWAFARSSAMLDEGPPVPVVQRLLVTRGGLGAAILAEGRADLGREILRRSRDDARATSSTRALIQLQWARSEGSERSRELLLDMTYRELADGDGTVLRVATSLFACVLLSAEHPARSMWVDRLFDELDAEPGAFFESGATLLILTQIAPDDERTVAWIERSIERAASFAGAPPSIEGDQIGMQLVAASAHVRDRGQLALAGRALDAAEGITPLAHDALWRQSGAVQRAKLALARGEEPPEAARALDLARGFDLMFTAVFHEGLVRFEARVVERQAKGASDAPGVSDGQATSPGGAP